MTFKTKDEGKEPDTKEPDTKEPDTEEPDTKEPDTEEPDIEEEIDRSDFTKHVKTLSAERFALEMHKRLVEESTIVQNQRSTFDVQDINKVLARFPQFFSWAIVESELIQREYQIAKDHYENWYQQLYGKMSQQVTGRVTIDAVKAAIAETHAVALKEEQHRLYDMEVKANVAKGMVKVWGAAINSLQSLSRNIAVEAEIIRKEMT